MSETLKIVFQADDADLQSALQRSSRRLDDFDKRFSKRRDALPVSSSSFTAWEKSAGGAAKAARELEGAAKSAGRAGSAAGFGFLAFSQAVEDSQYGIRGVLNNIPQMVIGFGGSAGIAGAISIAAVAATQAAAAFQKLSGIDDMEAWAKAQTAAAEAMTKSLAEARAEAEALAASRRAAADRAELSERAGNRRGDLQFDSTRLAEIEKAAAAAERLRNSQAAVAAVALGSLPEARDGQQLGESLTEAARVEFLQRGQRLTAELADEQAKLNLVSEEYQRIWRETGEQFGALQLQRNASQGGADDIRRTIGDLKAELAAEEAIVANAPAGAAGRGAAERAAGDLKAKIAEQQALLAEREKEVSLLQSLMEQAQAEGRASIQQLSGKRAAIKENISALRDNIKAERELAEVTKESIALKALRKEESAIEERRDDAAGRAEALGELEAELKFLRNKVELGNKAAEAMQREVELQAQAAELAAKTGQEQEDVLALLRDRAALQEKLAKGEASGTVRERREQRSAERAEARAEARNERQREARRNQAERNRKANDSKLNPKKDEGVERLRELEERRKKAEADKAKADAALGKNVAEQLEIQKGIKELLANIGAA